jgi:hypothetical protein
VPLLVLVGELLVLVGDQATVVTGGPAACAEVAATSIPIAAAATNIPNLRII